MSCYGELPKRIYRGLDERWRIGSFTHTDTGPVRVDYGLDFEGPDGDSPWDKAWSGVLVSKSQTWWSP